MLGRDGQPLPRTRQSLIIWTMTKTGETWLIDAFQNTDIGSGILAMQGHSDAPQRVGRL
jgi:hypothetical protein